MRQLIIFAALTFTFSVFADHHDKHKEHDHHQTKRSHGSHTHGQAKVDVVHEGKNLFIKAVFTGFDVFGFAQKPKSKKDKDTYLTKMTSLKTKASEYFVLPKSNKCTYKSSPELEYEGNHSELNWNLIIRCEKKPTVLDSQLIKMLPLVKKIKYSVIPYVSKDTYGKTSSAKQEKLNI